LYAERFPGRRTPSRISVSRVIKQFSEENVRLRKRNRRKTATDEDHTTAVLAAVNLDPQVSTRTLCINAGISKVSILSILKQRKFHPYHVSLHQELNVDDFVNRILFCTWAEEKIRI